MKKENGITLVSLVIYIIVMTIALSIMTAITTNFYSNTETVQGNVKEIVEFNNFNTYFLKEVKLTNNKVDEVSSNYILFSSGNSFLMPNNENTIYYNNIKICEGVQDMEITLQKDANGENTIINVTLTFENFKKSIKYKVENIY